MKTVTISLILMATALGICAQDFEVSKNYQFDQAEDYAAYEQDVIECFNWLMNTPINEQTEKRRAAYAFLVTWISGSPNVTIEISPQIVTFIEGPPDLLMMFMGGWTKYALQSQNPDNKFEGIKSGIKAVIEFYQNNREFLQEDENVEKYIEMKQEGTLEAYIERHG